jgi:alkylmercury lyase-like protein
MSSSEARAAGVEIRTAAEILAPESASEWEARRAQRDDPLLRAIWWEFVETGGPVALATASRRMAGIALATVRARAAELDAADLIALDGDRVALAYPFTARPNDFAVVLPDGRLRYACCAIDALGVAPMLAMPVRLRSRCHRSGEALDFDINPVDGPRHAPAGSLAWVERSRWGGDRRSGYF